MKKIVPVLVAVLAAGGLTACGSSDEAYIKEVFNNGVAFANNDLMPGMPKSLIQDDPLNCAQNFVRLVRKQVTPDNKKTVEIEWEIDNPELVERIVPYDDNTDMVEMKYPEIGESVKQLNFHIKSMKCGSTVKDYEAIGLLSDDGYYPDYTVNLQPKKYKHDEYSIAQLLQINETQDEVYPSQFNVIDYTLTDKSGNRSPWFKKNYEQEYLYVKTYGKVKYIAPDNNFAILTDGDNAMELYWGGKDNEKYKSYPDLKVGNYVEVQGEYYHYCGNMQVSYINRIRTMKDHSKVAEPTQEFTELTSDAIKAMRLPGGKDKQHTPIMNKLMYVKAKFVKGSIDNTKNTLSGYGIRHTFKVELEDGTQMNCSYDYHVSNDGTVQYNSALPNALNTMFADADSYYYVKGTVRYEGVDKTLIGDVGNYKIVPFAPEHIRKA